MYVHTQGREVQILLGDLTSKLDDNADRIDDNVTRHLEGLVATLLSHSRDGSLNLLTSDNLLKVRATCISLNLAASNVHSGFFFLFFCCADLGRLQGPEASRNLQGHHGRIHEDRGHRE